MRWLFAPLLAIAGLFAGYRGSTAYLLYPRSHETWVYVLSLPLHAYARLVGEPGILIFVLNSVVYCVIGLVIGWRLGISFDSLRRSRDS